jgi:BirA family biotin operon repressor/biotin-[acetyl-CoA-carboxylase] ligase
VSESLNTTRLSAALAGPVFAGKLHHFASVESTNLLAIEAAQAGAPDGSVWVADQQTAGRGRGGHQWHSAPGDGLYVSILLRPQMVLTDALWLSLATGLAVKSAIHAVTGLSADIRWPNDILFGEKKCGGILVETSATAPRPDSPSMLRYAVIGVGINVNHTSFPPALEPIATSLREQAGTTFEREDLLAELLQCLKQEIDLLEAEQNGASNEPGLLARFSAASSWVRGKRVSVEEGGGYTGVTDGLDGRGFLRVAGDDGTRHTVLSGGVRAYSNEIRGT